MTMWNDRTLPSSVARERGPVTSVSKSTPASGCGGGLA